MVYQDKRVSKQIITKQNVLGIVEVKAVAGHQNAD
jgi:hypothetical protein